MQVVSKALLCLSLFAAAAPAASAVKANPLEQVVALMDSLTAKLIKEGEAEDKAYKEFVNWCQDASTNIGFEIKTSTSKKGKLEAKIAKLAEDIETGSSKIEDLAASISSDEKDLSDATAVREKEAAEFVASEKELVETIDTLGRAISILERMLAKNPAAFTQVDASSLNGLLKVLGSIVDAASFKNADRDRIMALVQAKDNADDDDMQPGAPAAKAYKSHSSGIFDVLEDMKEKAEEQLTTLRKEEVATKHNYEMLKQSLEDQISADTKALDAEKTGKAEAQEGKATAEGDLATTVKEIAGSQDSLKTAMKNCMETASDHDASVKARAEEMKVIAEAKKIVSESTSGASDQTYSLIQVGSNLLVGSNLQTRADLANAEVVTAVRKLAKETHSAALAQLASRIAAILRFGANAGDDPFAKVKGMLQAMIEKLEKEAAETAEEKAYCDEQMAKTDNKQSELQDDVDKLSVKIDSAASASADLKADVKELQSELAELSKSQAVMDNQRREANAEYNAARKDLTEGLTAVRKALGVLRDYYGSAASSAAMLQASQPAPPQYHAKAGGAGGSIISLLEVVESDMAKSLAEKEMQESTEATEYEKMSFQNKFSKASKEQDVKYKTQEHKSLDKSIAEMKGDLASTSNELNAVNMYYGQIKERCIAKPETFTVRAERRAKEIQGLKDALDILENETAFTQNRKRGLRSHFLHA